MMTSRPLWLGAALLACACQVEIDADAGQGEPPGETHDVARDAAPPTDALDPPITDTLLDVGAPPPPSCPAEALEPEGWLYWGDHQAGHLLSSLHCVLFSAEEDFAACLEHRDLPAICVDCVRPVVECCPVACWNGTRATCALCLHERGCAAAPPVGCGEVSPWPDTSGAWLDLEAERFTQIEDLDPAGITPARAVDWWGFAQGSWRILWSHGEPCAGATDPGACGAAIEAATAGPFEACFESDCYQDELHGYYPTFVIFTAGDEVGVITDREALAEFLAPIETMDEALLLAAAYRLRPSRGSHGYDILSVFPQVEPWVDWTNNGARETERGFELLLEEDVNACPWSYDRVQVEVERGGAFTIIRRQLAWISEMCS